MRVIDTDIAQSLQLFIPEEVTAPTGIYMPEIVTTVSERYRFVTSPDTINVLSSGAKFEQGQISIGGELINVRQLSIFNDGLVVLTKDTDISDLVLDEFAGWLISRHKFRRPTTVIPRRYLSSVVVEFDTPIDHLLKPFRQLMDSLSVSFSRTYGRELRATGDRISFSVDPAQCPPNVNTEFIVERRNPIVGETAGRYYCVAPLRTSEHLATLREFESALNGG